MQPIKDANVSSWGKWKMTIPALLLPLALAAAPVDEAAQLAKQALVHIRANENVRALTELQKAVKLAPRNALYYRYLASAQANLGHFKEALVSLQTAISLQPNDADTHYLLGIVYARLGRWSDCVHEWEITLLIDPNQHNAQDWLPLALARSSKIAQMLPQALQAALKPPTPGPVASKKPVGIPTPSPSPTAEPPSAKMNAEGHFQLGNQYQQQGNYSAAISEYRAALAVSPNFSDAHYQLAQMYGKLGQWADAVQEYEEVVRINSYSPVASQELPAALAELHAQAGGQHEQASDSPKPLRLHELDSNVTEFHFLQGNSLYNQGLLPRAVDEYRESMQYIPASNAVHYNLGLALYQLHHSDEAIAEFRLAIRLRPDDAYAHYNLGLLLANEKLPQAWNSNNICNTRRERAMPRLFNSRFIVCSR